MSRRLSEGLNFLTEEEISILSSILMRIKIRKRLIREVNEKSNSFNILKRGIAEDNIIIEEMIRRNRIRNIINEKRLIDKIKREVKRNPKLLYELTKKRSNDLNH